MRQSLILGIDVGTQALKVAALDEGLRLRGRGATVYPTPCVRYPRPGWAEQDPLLWERALRPAVAAALREARGRPADVRAVGIAGQLDGCLAADAGGAPLTPCLIWQDRRGECPRAGAADIRRRAGVNPDPGHMAAKIRWLLDHDPAAPAAALFHQPVSWLVQRLTGAAVIDPALASTSMLVALETADYDPALLAAFGLSRSLLPPLVPAHHRAGAIDARGGERSGLPAGTPVAVGTGDDFAGTLGAGVTAPGSAVCLLGTAEVVGALADRPLTDPHPEGLVETHCFPGGRFFVENPGWMSGGAVEWLARALGLAGAAEVERAAAGAEAGAGGVLFLPALSGAMAPAWVPEASGCFHGLRPAHGREHLARALLEGCAFAMRDVLDRLAEMGRPAREVVFTGGGAASRLWAQIRADVSGLPVRRTVMTDTTALGAALLAAVAGGLASDLPHAAARLQAANPFPREEHRPDPARREAYERAYAGYRRLFDCLRPLYRTREAP